MYRPKNWVDVVEFDNTWGDLDTAGESSIV